MTNQLYWLGNAAKAFVIREILESASSKPVTVLDHGCGKGGDWPLILRNHSNVRLLAWDPDPLSAELAKAAVPAERARVSVGEFPAGARADVVVSFSVLEHVRDKPQYLVQARDALEEGGCFYLNYDDGHFRNVLDLDEPNAISTWLRALRRQRLYRRSRGATSEFQKRVTSDEVISLVSEAGFRVERSWYHNLMAFKWLAKSIPARQRVDFVRFWLDVEGRLNDEFAVESGDGPRRGDASALWQIVSSRTLLLRV